MSIGECTAKVGETVSVEITLYDVATGLSGYDIEVSLENEKIARIVNVILPAFGLKDIGDLPSSSVRIKAVDLNETVSSGVKEASLATLEFEGLYPGTTDIIVFVRAMDDDDGNPIEPDISQGHIEVLSSTTTSTSTDTPESIPIEESEATSTPRLPPTEGLTLSMGGEMTVPVDDSTAIELKLHNIDKGLSGYDVTISVENEELAEVVNVVLPNFGITEVGDLPNSSVRIRVIDLNDIISLQMEEALLATLELEGMKPGTSEIVVSIRTMDDDNGNALEPEVIQGSVRVVGDGAEGYLVSEGFFDDFNDGDDDGWGHEVGHWVVTDGAYTATKGSELPRSSLLDYTFSDFVFEGDLSIGAEGAASVGLRVQSLDTATNTGLGAGVLLVVFPGGNSIYWHVVSDGTGDPQNVRPLGISVSEEQPLHIRIEVVGDTYTVFVNGQWKNELKTAAYSSGQLVLGVNVYYPLPVSWDNIGIAAP